MMLRHIGEQPAADRIRGALDRVLAARQVRTQDLGGKATGTAFTDAICEELAKG
jgi:tartrate dehydrogenase/decarboxylase/D-malate dehydrogenase